MPFRMANALENHGYFGKNDETSEFPMRIIIAAGNNGNESSNTQKLPNLRS